MACETGPTSPMNDHELQSRHVTLVEIRCDKQEVEKMENENQTDEKNAPVMKIQAGAIQVAIWANKGQRDGEETTFNTVSIERSFKNKNDEWQNTNSLRVNDLPKAALALTKAYEHLVLNQKFGTELM